MTRELRLNVLLSIAGIVLGLIIAGLIVQLGGWLKTDYSIQMPTTERYYPKWDTSFWSYERGIVDDRSERYFSMGKDWIMIKDFPGNIEKHWGLFTEESTRLWGYPPSITEPQKEKEERPPWRQ